MRRLFPTLLASLALHATLLWTFQPFGEGARTLAAIRTLTLHLRAQSHEAALHDLPPEASAAPLPTTSMRVPDAIRSDQSSAGASDGSREHPPPRPEEFAEPARYYLRSEVDQTARLLEPIELAIATPIEQPTIVARVLVNEKGTVDNVQVAQALRGTVLGEAAITALSGARFRPAEKGGTPVKSQLLFRIDYGHARPKAEPAPG